MSERLTCSNCGHGIDNGRAIIRSIAFEQVARHRDGECVNVPAQLAKTA